jgi:hypothetical protein
MKLIVLISLLNILLSQQTLKLNFSNKYYIAGLGGINGISSFDTDFSKMGANNPSSIALFEKNIISIQNINFNVNKEYYSLSDIQLITNIGLLYHFNDFSFSLHSFKKNYVEFSYPNNNLISERNLAGDEKFDIETLSFGFAYKFKNFIRENDFLAIGTRIDINSNKYVTTYAGPNWSGIPNEKS